MTRRFPLLCFRLFFNLLRGSGRDGNYIYLLFFIFSYSFSPSSELIISELGVREKELERYILTISEKSMKVLSLLNTL